MFGKRCIPSLTKRPKIFADLIQSVTKNPLENTQYEGMTGDDNYEQYAYNKATESQERIAAAEYLKRQQEEIEKRKKEEQQIKEKILERERKLKEEEEKKKSEPQEMDIDNMPTELLQPPVKEGAKKEFTNVQKEEPLGSKKLFYTQIIKNSPKQ